MQNLSVEARHSVLRSVKHRMDENAAIDAEST